MQKTKIASVAIVGALALTLLAAGPASAEDSAGNATVTVIPGVISLSTVYAGALGGATSGATAVDGEPLAVTEGEQVAAMTVQATVNDATSGTANWSVSVKISPFTATVGDSAAISAATTSMANATLSYVPAASVDGDKSGTSTVVRTARTSMPTTTTDSVFMAATAVSGYNTAVSNASLKVKIPVGALANTYTATITHTLGL